MLEEAVQLLHVADLESGAEELSSQSREPDVLASNQREDQRREECQTWRPQAPGVLDEVGQDGKMRRAARVCFH